jgi:hypothetical protein
MAEQTFRSPGFFDREFDQSQPRATGPTGVPAGVIGTSQKGPAFVPVTVSNFGDFVNTFGNLDPKRFGPYAVNEFLKHRNSLTFLRVLGAGTTATTSDIAKQLVTGQAKNAGFVVTGSTATASDLRHNGSVQFISARHSLQANEAFGMPMFTENDSYTGSTVNLVRGMVLLASGARMMILDGNEAASSAAFLGQGPDDFANVNGGYVKLVLSSTNGSSFGVSDGLPGLQIYTASFDPTSPNYFGKLLNTDPDKFATAQHLLYADFAVDNEIATAISASVMSGSATTSNVSGDTTMAFRNVFGHFDSRYTVPRTPTFISQPYGTTEYDLFRFEARDDGEYANKLYKISISNLKVSSDQLNPYGTFTVLVRDWNDSDTNQNVIEQFPNCSLNPDADNYVAKIIGDRRVYYNFDSEADSERRLVVSGKYANQSQYIRITVDQAVERKQVPASALPFGFRGVELLKTNDNLRDTAVTSNGRLAGVGVGVMSQSLVPPIPFRFKVTRGAVATSGFVGAPGQTEIVNGNYFWGVKFERNNTDALNTNVNSEKSKLVESYTKFLGIKKLDTRITGTGADTFNNNKFTLARVALGNQSVNDLTGTIETHMKDAAYIRNGKPDPATYTISDGVLSNRLTLASLVALTSSVQFNRFSTFAKFTTFLYGGFDGLNTLDPAARRMNDRSVSFDSGGAAESTFVSPGLAQNQAGVGSQNSTVFAYKSAVDIMTNPMTVNLNVLTIPGIREPYITDYAAKKTRDYGLAIYLMDIPAYDDSSLRLYDDSTGRPDVKNTASSFDGRALDNNYVASYFPDVFVDDSVNKRRVKVPASIAALAALGLNDRVAYPWFAPAGFNRAALDFVTNVMVRLNGGDRDTLSDVRINPIASFPREGFVIFGQRTLQQAHSALDRVNVRRLLLEVKRLVIDVAMRMTFENNTPSVREKFVKDATTLLGLIQTQQGINTFSVIMNETNNTQADVENNRVNGRIVIVPTRTFEYIAIDFIITNAGVQFV